MFFFNLFQAYISANNKKAVKTISGTIRKISSYSSVLMQSPKHEFASKPLLAIIG